MPTTEDELIKIAALAHIQMDSNSTQQLANDISAIMDFVEQLRQIETTSVAPLLHPLHLHQRLRLDDVDNINCIPALEKIAPIFADNLYLVPKLGPFANEGK